MTTSKTYTAIYERDVTGDAWNVRIKGIDGRQTYGRSLRQAQSGSGSSRCLARPGARSVDDPRPTPESVGDGCR